MNTLRTFALLALMLPLWAGCLQFTPLAQCFTDSDCPAAKGETCNGGICVPGPSRWIELTQTQNDSRKVDILFVVDNSGSMKEEQDKLARSFQGFIDELTSQDVGDLQIGIVTTDMSDASQSGRLQGSQPFLSTTQMSRTQLTQAFRKAIVVGTKGSPFEQGLEAMKSALSTPLLDGHNAGFLRKDAILVVVFVADEDDCSHPGSFETNTPPEVCRYPSSQPVKDDKGLPILDKDGKEIKGKLDALQPTSSYVEFLKGLGKKVVVMGLIGDPKAYRTPQSQEPLDPVGGCKSDLECSRASTPHKCGYNGQKEARSCGGCKSDDADAAPGFRYFELIKAFGGANHWFPICDNDGAFQQSMLSMAQDISSRLNTIALEIPVADPQQLAVTIHTPGNDAPQPLSPAPKLDAPAICSQHQDCGKQKICGPGNRCYGDGWVYFPPQGRDKAQLQLSGAAQGTFAPKTTLKVRYPRP